MMEPRRLTALWAFTACYRDSFTVICRAIFLFFVSEDLEEL
jgi:hypothetical protein